MSLPATQGAKASIMTVTGVFTNYAFANVSDPFSGIYSVEETVDLVGAAGSLKR
jgi:hypothetical protein